MTDLIERLRVAVVTEVNPDDGKTYTTKLGEEAAGEIAKWRSLASDWRRACDKAMEAGLTHQGTMAYLTAMQEAVRKLGLYADEVLK